MPHAFEAPLAQIREQLLLMSSLTERNVMLAMRALTERDDAIADTVEIEDAQLDHLEVQIDEMVITYMATRGPVATDCRFMLCASKIARDLERIGDESTTIARRARELNRESQLKPFVDIPLMAETAQEMLRDAITAFIDGNAEVAPEIIARDKSVDAVFKELSNELAEIMSVDGKTVRSCLGLLRVAKALERVADHAANIAEEVYYLYRARDLRHERQFRAEA